MRLELELPVWNARTNVKALIFTSGGLCLLPSYISMQCYHSCMWFSLRKMYLIMLGRHWFDFYFFLHHHNFFKLTQHAILYLSGKQLSHWESSGHYLHSVGFAEVRTTGAKMPVPELYHCSGGACHSQSFSWGFRNSLNEKTSMWIQVIGCKAWDFIFVFVSMQQGRATSHPVLNRISPVLVGFLWKLISTTENSNIFSHSSENCEV